MRSVMIETLKQCYLFKGTSEAELERFLSSNLYRIKSYDKEEYALYANDPCNDLPLLISGIVRGEMSDLSGKMVKIEDIAAPAVLASAFIFGPQNKYPVDVIANEPSKILFIPKDALMKIFSNYPSILKNFLDDISNRAQFLTRKIRFLTFRTIREKLAYYFLELSHKNQSDNFILPMTQTKLADFFGVTRPSLARTLSELVKENMIEIERNSAKIVDKRKLLKISGY
jgi:CRP/FNR family transcriptional regulator, dissimilatory nitrate respiration regulator